MTRTALLLDEYGNVYVDDDGAGVGLQLGLGPVLRDRAPRPMPAPHHALSHLQTIRPRRGGTLTLTPRTRNPRTMTPNLSGVAEVGTALEVAEASDGRQQLAKLTSKGNLLAGSDNVLTFSINNTSATPQTILLGDASTLINEGRNIGALPDEVEVGGTYGERTHPQFMLNTGLNPQELSGLHILVSDEKFFASGAIRYIKAKPTGNLTTQTISMAGRINESQQQTNVLRKDDFVCTIDAYSAIEITIPGNTTVDLTTTITGSAEAYSMVDL